MHLYPINGACHRVAADETAFAYREANFATVIVAAWQDPALDNERIQWVRDYYQATAPHSEPGGYVNFMADDDQARVQDNYRGNFTRLADIKRRYDPDNLFHLDQARRRPDGCGQGWICEPYPRSRRIDSRMINALFNVRPRM